MDETLSVRFPRENLKEIELLSKEERRKKSEILRDVLYLGIMQKKLEIALKKFQNNELTVSKASELSGIPLTAFLDILQKKGINFHYSLEELREDFDGLI